MKARLPRTLAVLLAAATLAVAMAGGRRVAGGDTRPTLNELIAGASLPEAWRVVERLRDSGQKVIYETGSDSNSK